MANYDLSKLKILVADDSNNMRAVLNMILTKLGVAKVRLCSDGGEAFKEFCKEPYDIVITDWVMKPMSSIELAGLLRNPKKSPHPCVPIIMVTSNSAREEVVEAREAGIDTYLAKPITPDSVYSCISKLIHKTVVA